ncbi:MAG TPA: hypothetical protein ENN80_09335, partial [Candidatus Hydrogenedentes bacterium]|nr:hypothetical protein [Candidatus Hydrogenedentota bacterium]
MLNGATEGRGFLPGKNTNPALIPSVLDVPAAFGDRQFIWDYSMPGYGRVDDDASAFWMAFDGLDNDGDGLVDEGLGRLPPLDRGHPLYQDTNAPLYLRKKWERVASDGQLGGLEGIDEPSERRLYRPYRNLFAEDDGGDNDGGGLVDEVGELGDRVFSTREQIKRTHRIGPKTYDNLENLITVHSGDANRIDVGVYDEQSMRDQREVVRLDLNYAQVRDGEIFTVNFSLPFADRVELESTHSDPNVVDLLAGPKSIWREHYKPLKLLRRGVGEYEAAGRPGERRDSDPLPFARQEPPDPMLRRLFAAGLLQEDTTFVASPWDYAEDGTIDEVRMRADNALRAAQLAANVRDYLDADHTRTEIKVRVPDDWWDAITNGGVPEREIEYTLCGIESIRINEMMVRPVRRVEAEMLFWRGPEPWNHSPDVLFDPPFLRDHPDNVGAPDARPFHRPNLAFFDPEQFGCWFDYSALPPGGTAYSGGAEAPNQRVEFKLQFDVAQYFTVPDVWWRTPWDAFGVNLPQKRSRLPMGPGSVFRTVVVDDNVEPPYIEPVPPDPPQPNYAWRPNVIQFRFGPSTGLPPGRYYLLVNTRNRPDVGWNPDDTMAWGEPTVERADPAPYPALPIGPYDTIDIEYAIKYGYAPEHVLGGPYTDVLTDIETDPFLLEHHEPVTGVPRWNVWQSVVNPGWDPGMPTAKVGVTGLDEETGFVFLPSWNRWNADPSELPLEFVPQGAGGLMPPSVNPMVGYKNGFAYTVVIPPYATRPDPDDPSKVVHDPMNQVYLYVAIRKPINWGGDLLPDLSILSLNGFKPLSIDFFDFSQEPDHEWIELINIEEWDPQEPAETQYVDLSGWELEVGPPDAFPDDEQVQQPERFTIPEGTRIAPGGTLLLCFNKHDFGAHRAFWSVDPGYAFNNPPLSARSLLERNGIGMATWTLDDNGVLAVPLDRTNPLSISVPPTTLFDVMPPPDGTKAFNERPDPD